MRLRKPTVKARRRLFIILVLTAVVDLVFVSGDPSPCIVFWVSQQVTIEKVAGCRILSIFDTECFRG